MAISNIISSNTFCSPFFFPLFWGSNYTYNRLSDTVLQVPKVLIFLASFITLSFRLDSFIVFTSPLLFLYFLLLNACSEFLFQILHVSVLEFSFLLKLSKQSLGELPWVDAFCHISAIRILTLTLEKSETEKLHAVDWAGSELHTHKQRQEMVHISLGLHVVFLQGSGSL